MTAAERPDALRRALAALRDMKERLDRAESAAREPIAVIGAGCRFPGGADSPAAYWELLRSGGDAVGPVPADRWDAEALYDPDPDAPGKICTDQGGFVDWPVDRFDAGFFGISPREAASLDPQQRLLLEVAWEALEDAGLRADDLAGSATGVFVGMGTTDYANLQLASGDPTEIGTYFGTGVAPCVAAGRLSYVLGLRGPALTLDTACSSSLVAVVQAIQSLRSGACDAALAGGVNLMLDPQSSIFLSRFRALSPTGRCHTFSAAADGYARGEGCGLVVLKRLSDAEADGDRILAVIRGAAVNHDGRSSGLTVPSGAAQRSVIERALADAGLAPTDVDLVEAHGTGTELGDPIEVRALDAVYGVGRAEDAPLLVGSAKTNLGHLEAAAGVAGLLKLVLALQHEEIPPHLHFDEPSPHIDWSAMAVSVVSEGRSWPRSDRRRRAGVSAFGFSGTNAHLIVEEPPLAAPEGHSRPVEVLTLSARDEPALRELAGRFADHLEHASSPLADVAWTTQVGRARHRHRLGLAARTAPDAAARLRSWLAGEASSAVALGAPVGVPKIAFVFTGQGAQHPGMGAGLYRSEPVFRAAMDECARLLAPELERPLLDVLYGGDPAVSALVHDTTYAQPALFAVEFGLAQLWRSWGIEPNAVLGHSIGEYVAATVAGVLDLEDALRLIAARGRLMGALPAGGAMVAVFTGEQQVEDLIGPYRAVVGVAALNGPANTVLSGDREAIDAIVRALDASGIGHRELNVSHAFHSPLMDPVLGELAEAASSVSFREPKLQFASTVTGRLETVAFAEADYWIDHARATVRFADAAATLLAEEFGQFVEIGPQPTLLGAIGRLGSDPSGLHPSLRPDRDDDEQMAGALGRLWAAGCEPDWKAVHGSRPQRLELPTYPFQRERHWVDLRPTRDRAARAADLHPLVHRRVRSPALTGSAYESSLGVGDLSYLNDHRVFDVAVMPATGFLEAVLAAARDTFGPRAVSLEQVALVEMLVFPEVGARQVHVVLGDPVGQRATFEVFSLGADETWRRHASGVLNLDPAPGPIDRIDVAAVRALADRSPTVDVEDCYERFRDRGLDYRGAFRALRQVVRGSTSTVGRVALPAEAAAEAGGYTVHPALLDGCLQLLGAAMVDEDDDDGALFVPVGVDAYHVEAPAGSAVWARVQVKTPLAGGDVSTADVELFGEEGELVAALLGIEIRRVDRGVVGRQLARLDARRFDGWQYETVWDQRAAPIASRVTRGAWAVLAGDDGLGTAVAGELRTRGHAAVLVHRGDAVGEVGEGEWTADLSSSTGVQRLLEAARSPEGAWAGVVAVAAPGSPVPLAGDDDPLRELLATVQGLLAAGGDQPGGSRASLWVLTRGAQCVNDEATPVSVAHAALWGMVNAVGLEEPSLSVSCVDLSAVGEVEVAALVDELLGDSAEDRVALRAGHRYVQRLVHVACDRLLELPPTGYTLAVRERGTFDGLALEPSLPPSARADEVVVSVRASGVNFRDVLNVLGVYPGEAGAVGSECAGVVVAAGEEVTEVAVGDEVIALVDGGGFGRDVVTPARLVFPMPRDLDFAAAATLPIAFLTAQHGLHGLARLRAGDVVLVHAAAGGVGLAAVQLALRAGATVIGTAGSDEKRAYLRALGVAHVFDSRTLEFASQVMEVTGGRGVDVALSSLADEFIGATFDVVAPGGVFLEIGKRDVLSPEAAAEHHPDVHYHLYDLADVVGGQPDRLRRMMHDVLARVEAGDLIPLPRRCFGIRDVRAAFRHMAMARHIGKVVVTHAPGEEVGVEPGHVVAPDACYLVTGGLGGLGLEAAVTLADHGARNLVLLSRQAGTAHEPVLDRLRAAGVRVEVLTADVSRRDDLELALERVRATMPPLRGIIHAAGVLDDALVRRLDWSQFGTVMAGKAAGAWHLHELTADDRLDFFVMYSSMASLVGAAGQANYASANAFLDGLAQHRAALGRPALSVSWGAWSGVGMAARLASAGRPRGRQPVQLIDPAEGAALLPELLESPRAHVGVAPISWARVVEDAGDRLRPFFELMARDVVVAGPAATASRSGADDLARAPLADRPAIVRDHVRASVATLLGLTADGVDDDVEFPELGMDSLMGVELRNRLDRSLAITLGPTATFEWPTLRALSDHITHDLLGLPRDVAGDGEWEVVGADRPLPAPPASAPTGRRRASSAQRRFLFLSDFNPDSPLFNLPNGARVTGPLDLAALQGAFDEVARRHEPLRTGFEVVDDEVWQVALEPRPVPLAVHDLRSVQREARPTAVGELVRQEAETPFDLRRDIKLRVLALRLEDDEHVLVVTTHHIACDGWSIGRIVGELGELYRAAIEGDSPRLPELAMQYADHAEREWTQLALPAAGEHVAYWTRQLGGGLPILSLPTDRPRPAVQTHRAGFVRVPISPELLSEVRRVSRECAVTPFMTLLASYAATLARHSGQDEVVVGTVTANRPHAEMEPLIGPFVNTLALRLGVDGRTSFRALQAEVKRVAVEGFAHQDIPFDHVVEAVNPPRDLGRSPIFQAMFVLQNMPVPALTLAGAEAEPVQVGVETLEVDLSLELTVLPSGTTATLRFNRDLFDVDTMERFAARWLVVLASALADPERAVGELAWLPDEERRAVEASWWGRVEPATAEVCVHTLVERQVAATPDRVAVRFEAASLTFAELDHRANQLAHHLRAAGVTAGDLVAVHLERSLDMVVAVLGVLKAGAGYVPIDPRLPDARIAFMLEDTATPVVVTTSSGANGLPRPEWGDGPALVLVDAEADAIAARPDTAPVDVGVTSGDCAYLIYTSGSTGRPKGVEVPHGSTASFMTSMARDLGLTDDDVLLSVTTLSFDISVLELFLPLVSGAQVVVADRHAAQDPVALARVLDEAGTTIFQATPTTWRMLIDAGWQGRDGLVAVSGGEPMSLDLARALLGRCGRLWNCYGPTETTIYSTMHLVGPEDLAATSIPIGPAIDNTSCYVLDARRQPLPVGVPGELYIGGAGLARGYLNRPELTAERFIPDPFAATPGARMYQTGDVCRLLPNGDLEALGRSDHQVKVRGYRIELGEIEHNLVAHPGVRAAVVTTWEPAPGDVRLAAYYVPTERGASEAELREHLRDVLPGYMVPAAYLALDELPRTSNNKIDRKQLPIPTTSEHPTYRRRGPETSLQSRLAAMWTEVLGRRDISVDDDFFDLGGHSLLATQIVSRIRAGLGVEVPVRALFEHPTIGELAEWVETAREGAAPDALVPAIAALGRHDGLPLTAAQERMWFLYELQPESPAYNMPGAVRLRGPLDVPALAAAIDDLVARHEGLRTTFPLEDGRPVQRIAPSGHVEVQVLDRRSLPGDRLAAIGEELHLASQLPFRLEELPLLRCVLYVLDDDDHVLFVNMHHIVGDQWSFGVLGRDLAACYRARRAGHAPELAPLTVQFGDYAAWHRGWVDGRAIDGQLEYWRNQLADYPTIDLPTDRSRPPVQSGRGAAIEVNLTDEVLEGINALCVQYRVSPFMVLLAALDLLIHRYASADDIVIGTPIANRNWLESEGLLGAFVNTVVMRTDLSGNPSFAELLARVQRVALDAYANQDAPFATVVNELNPVRDLSRSPLFQIFLNVLNARVEPLDLDEVVTEPLLVDRGAAQFDLSLSVDLTMARSIALEYSTDLYDERTIERLARHLLTVLRAVVADPATRVGDVALLSVDERAELEASWSGPAVDVEDGVAAHTLVERQVARTPDRVALRSGVEALTYRELDGRANRLARHLIDRGVTPGDLVGIHLERSVEMVVAVLAVLKAGGGYLPLDPALPDGRLGFMLEDAAVGLVISREHARLADDDQGSASRPTLVLLDADAAAIAACSTDDPGVPVDSHGRAHVIFTSGSTGRPKGVDVEHRSVVSFLQAMAVEPGISADDVVLGGTTLAFDPSVLELFLPLMCGAQLVIADRPTMLDPKALAQLLREAGVTVMQATPTTWRMLVDDGWAGEPGLTALYGGEPMPPDLLAAMLVRCATLWNLYGPTETTVWATVHRVEAATDRTRGSVPVGRPVDNTHCYVLDPYGHVQPIGVPGELHIGGAGVARGYLNRAELTEDRFVPDPFAADPAARMYRTGDLARLLPNGDLDLLGRVDHQVKIRGHRIELGEIEQTLSGHPAVRAAAVTTWTPGPGDVRLAAYFIPDGEHDVDADALRSFLRTTLPAYMIPAAYVEMDAFPLTASNKVDRKQLPPPIATVRGGSRRGPETPTQAELVQIWSDVLGQSDIGIDDDFFDLGGHSLLATRVFAAMEESTGRRLPLSMLFQAPTIEELARCYDESSTTDVVGEHDWTSLIAMQPYGTRPPFFYVSPFLITILSFSHLARCMQPDQPFFLFQPQGMEGDHPVHETVEEMAAHYISEMRQVQPDGPYRIGGHCAGAWVAFEMARQLQRDGHEVAMLLAVDSEPPGVTPPAIPLRHVVGRLRSYWRDGALRESLQWQLRVRRDRHISRRFGSGETQRLAALRYAHAEAHRRYDAAGRFDGDLVLIRSEDWARREDKDWHLQWQDLITGELVLDTIEGSHGDLVANTSAAALAEKIRSAIDRTPSWLWLLPLVLGPALTG